MAKKRRYVYEWPRPMVTVDAIVFAFRKRKARVLLIQRGHEPYKGRWALPGGFIEQDEELDDAVRRELEEETGLKNVTLRQMHTFGTCGRNPRGRQISVTFMGILQHSMPRPRAGDDAAKTGWFDIDKLPEKMAFDHDQIVSLAIGRLKRRKVYRLNTAGRL